MSPTSRTSNKAAQGRIPHDNTIAPAFTPRHKVIKATTTDTSIAESKDRPMTESIDKAKDFDYEGLNPAERNG